MPTYIRATANGDVPMTAEEIAEFEATRNPPRNITIMRKWDAIKAERSRRENGGVLVGGNWFHSDVESRIKIMGLVMLGVNIDPATQWKTMAKDGNGNPVFVPMNRDLANNHFLSIAVLDKAAYAKAEEHRIAMEAAADPAQYNIDSGWPAIFVG